MKKKGLRRLFRGALLLIFTLVSVSAIGQVRADALADGKYTVPVISINKDTGGTSASQAYLGKTGDVTVNNGTYTVSVPISAPGQDALKSASVQGSSVLDGSNLTFTLQGDTPQVQVDYHIEVTIPGMPKPLVNMSPSAYERFDWSKAQPVQGSSSSSFSSSSSSSSFSGSSSSSSIGSSSVSNGSGSSTGQSTLNENSGKITKMNYTVLQANGKSTSEANQYYTHVADVTKQSDGSYKVTMNVQYGKNSGMSAKGFVPLTVNGQKVSDVTYGSTDKDYTASFSFTVPSLDDLTKAPVKGTIHVSVPMMNISSNFDVYYNFTGATGDNGTGTTKANNSSTSAGDTNDGSQPSASAGAPTSAVTPASKTKSTAQKSSSKLPQTNEMQNVTVAAAGLISLILVVTTAIIRRKQA